MGSTERDILKAYGAPSKKETNDWEETKLSYNKLGIDFVLGGDLTGDFCTR